jgi:hypothetical protein
MPTLVPLAVLALAATAVLSGCGFTCSTVGWSNALVVEIGDADGVADVIVCDASGCSDDGMSATSLPPEPIGRDGDAWRFSLAGMTASEALTVRTLAADGAVLVETEVAPEWVRVGGSAQCGGPHEGTVRLEG